MANDYLQKIINIDNDFLENKIIYSKYDYQSEKYIEYSHHTLKNIIINRIEEVIIKIKDHLNGVLKSRNLPIVFVGEVTQISGFVNYVKKNSNLSNIRFYQSNIIGANHQM
jgi:cell division ATPase FtsA